MNPTRLADAAATPATDQPDAADALAGDRGGAGPSPRRITPTAGRGSQPQQSPGGPEGAPSAPARTCANCGAQLGPEQDWCLECGEGAPGSLEAGGPGWRSATTVLAATALLVLGAAGAGYAALSKNSHTPPRKVIALVEPAAAAVTPSPPAAGIPATPGAAAAPPSSAPPAGVTPPPKLPLSTPTPKATQTTAPSTPAPSSAGAGSPAAGLGLGLGSTKPAKSPSKPSTGTTTSSEPETPEPAAAILLDTNAASTYNPNGYPASEFGDPRLAIDGETATAWTARVNPATAPKMAAGLAVNLKSAQKVASLKLITTTPGITVQVYGAKGHSLPSSITDSAWTALSSAKNAKQTTEIKLRESSKAFQYVLLWISHAPASAVGTASKPGHVSVNELELLPPA